MKENKEKLPKEYTFKPIICEYKSDGNHTRKEYEIQHKVNKKVLILIY